MVRGPLGSWETGLCRGEDSAVRCQLSPFAVTLDVRCLLQMLSVPWHRPTLGCEASVSSPAKWEWEPCVPSCRQPRGQV